MKILSGIPVLHCRDIENTLSFYTDMLRFVVVNRREAEQAMQWVHIMHGDTGLMLRRLPADEQVTHTTPSIELYFFVDDVKELSRYLKSRNIDISDLIETDYRILEFSIRDPEGNRITLGQILTMRE